MAQRRMFSPKITGTDIFLDMPVSARELYFQLGMYADDDGFITPKRIMRMVGASDDDLKILLAKSYLIPFPNGAVVITGWKINNLIRKDWYQPTLYTKEKALLETTESGKYKLVNENVPNSLTEVSIGKVSIGKVSIGKVRNTSITGEGGLPFEGFWNLYPKKVERKKAEIAWGRLPEGVKQLILEDLPRRKMGEKWSKENGRFIENPLTYLHGERWNDEITRPSPQVKVHVFH